MSSVRRDELGWSRAGFIGFVVVVYFAIVLVWLPDRLLGLRVVAESSEVTQDLVAAGVWGIGLVAGLVALRVAQRSGRI